MKDETVDQKIKSGRH